MAKYIDAEEITPIMAEYVADVFSRKEHLDDISYGYCMEIADVFRRYAERTKQEQPEVDSEKPMNPEDAMKELDEKIALVKQRGTWDGVDVDKYMDEVRGREPEKPMNLEEEINRYLHEECSDDDEPGIHEIAEHFAEWGYLRAAEKYNEIEYNRQRAEESVPNDLEEAADEYEKGYYDDCSAAKRAAYHGFIAGAKWQKEHSFTHHETNESLEEAVTHQMEDDGDVDDFIRKGLDKTVLKYAQIGAEWQKQHDAELIEIAYNDGITIGMTKQKEQMLKEAVEGEVMDFSSNRPRPQVDVLLDPHKYHTGDKVRIIILKEE